MSTSSTPKRGLRTVTIEDLPVSQLKAFASDLRIEGFAATTIAEYVRRLGKLDEPILTPRAAKDHLAVRRDLASVNDGIVELRSLKAYSRWHAAEHGTTDELASMPFPRGTRAAPGKIARDADITKLMEALGTDLKGNARDIAIIELLTWTGCRRSEASKLNVVDVDFEQSRITFHDTKNHDSRHCPLHPRLARALRRWILMRADHRLADSPALFLGRDGRLLSNGVGEMLDRLGREHGVKVTAHSFRRRLAHVWAELGGRDDELMAIAGWRSSAMPISYRRELAKERAADAYARLFPPPRIKIVRSGRRSS